MTEHTSADATATFPAILGLDDVARRYRIGKTKAQTFVSESGFPNSAVPGMHRYPLAALELWDLARSLQGTVADPTRSPQPMPPQRGQVGRPPRREHRPAVVTAQPGGR
jgi:hypothetical protein